MPDVPFSSNDGHPLPSMSVAELDAAIQHTLDQIRADRDAYEERVALQFPDDGLTTDQRALAALDRPERFLGERDVARAWIRTSKTARVWRRNGS